MAPSDLQPTAYSLQPRPRRPRRAFTLTELLVVIAIIGVLASLITAAAVNALRGANRARIVLEIKQMASALENFKNDVGAYPPNGMFDGSTPEATYQQRVSDFQTMGKKLSPRINQQDMNVLIALAGGNGPNVTNGPLADGMTAAEAVYFWLGGFSQDPQFPISGPGGPSFDANDSEVLENRVRRYEFNLAQLGPRTKDGVFYSTDVDADGTGRYLDYNVDMNGNGNTTDAGEERRIHLWYYQPSGSEQPYVYFDCSRNKSYQYDVEAMLPNGPPVFPFKTLRQGKTDPTVPADIIFREAPKFQILHCGLDDDWGDFSPMRVLPTMTTPTALEQVVRFPQGPFTDAISDTLTNFTNGEVADEVEE